MCWKHHASNRRSFVTENELEVVMARIKNSKTSEVEEHFSWAGYTAPNPPDADEAPDPMEMVGYEMVQDTVLDDPDNHPNEETEK